MSSLGHIVERCGRSYRHQSASYMSFGGSLAYGGAAWMVRPSGPDTWAAVRRAAYLEHPGLAPDVAGVFHVPPVRGQLPVCIRMSGYPALAG